MKVALLEVSHWHFPLYAEALLRSGASFTGLSERDPDIRARYAAMFGCPGHESWRTCLADASPDVVFAFGRHAEMPEIAHALIDRRIPFAVEKPAGRNAADVASIRRAAAEANVPVGVPLVQRVGPLQGLLDRLISEEGASFTATAWRFNAGPPSRYTDIACGWMLEPESSGGGCLINLAPHFIDLARRLMPSEPDSVFARTDSVLHGTRVEDTAMVSLGAASGGRALIETGYNFPANPEKREYSFSLAGPGHYVQTRPGGVAIHQPGQAVETIDMNLDADPMYGIYATRFLEDIAAGRAPSPGLADLEPAMRIIDAAYESARTGQAVALP